MQIDYEVAGYYTLRVIKPDGSVREELTFPNIITNRGLNAFGVGGWNPVSSYGYCSVGTGTTTPAAANDALVAYKASTTTHFGSEDSGVSAAAPWYGYRFFRFEFPAGVAAGTLSEVGLGTGENGTQLYTRALITDSAGAATTITVLAGEILQVTYELRQYSPTADVTSSQTIGGTSYSLRVRAASANNPSAWSNVAYAAQDEGNSYGSTIEAYTGAIGAITDLPAGTYLGTGTLNTGTYVSGQYYVDRTFSFPLAQGNGSIGVLLVNCSRGCFQIGITPALVKTGAQTFTGTVRFTWARRTI